MIISQKFQSKIGVNSISVKSNESRRSTSNLNNHYPQLNSISDVVAALNKEEVIAYPTESIFAIGCDPDSKSAVNRLLELKRRSIEKGLILIAADFKQLKPYIDDSSLTLTQWKMVHSVWPGPVTFVFPARISTPYWLKGRFNSLAVRVTNHPLVIKLCYEFNKPLISTSANLTGSAPCRTAKEVYERFGITLPIANGKTGGRLNSSEIRDVLTGEYFRKEQN